MIAITNFISHDLLLSEYYSINIDERKGIALQKCKNQNQLVRFSYRLVLKLADNVFDFAKCFDFHFCKKFIAVV